MKHDEALRAWYRADAAATMAREAAQREVDKMNESSTTTYATAYQQIQQIQAATIWPNIATAAPRPKPVPVPKRPGEELLEGAPRRKIRLSD